MVGQSQSQNIQSKYVSQSIIHPFPPFGHPSPRLRGRAGDGVNLFIITFSNDFL